MANSRAGEIEESTKISELEAIGFNAVPGRYKRHSYFLQGILITMMVSPAFGIAYIMCLRLIRTNRY